LEVGHGPARRVVGLSGCAAERDAKIRPLATLLTQATALPPVEVADPTAPLPPALHGDFNHDGQQDEAQVFLTGRGYWLSVELGGRSNRYLVQWLGPNAHDLFLGTAKAERLQTWCGKGGGDSQDACTRSTVNLSGGELLFGVREAMLSVVLWNARTFEVVLLSD
jgi:hypothetical protein